MSPNGLHLNSIPGRNHPDCGSPRTSIVQGVGDVLRHVLPTRTRPTLRDLPARTPTSIAQDCATRAFRHTLRIWFRKKWGFESPSSHKPSFSRDNIPGSRVAETHPVAPQA
jgi:hypothetical protein